METDQKKDIDFSDYRPQTDRAPVVVVPPPDFERGEKKRKIQLAVIAVCLILAIGFWGYYFYQQGAKNRASKADMIPAEMIPE